MPYTVTQRFSRLLDSVDESLLQQHILTSDLKELVPKVIASIAERAMGAYYEKEVETPAGKVVQHIYRRPADPKSARLIIELANCFPSIAMQNLLSYTRAEQTMADVRANIARQKAKNLASQTALNTANTKVFEQMLITQDHLNDVINTLGGAILGFLKSIPFDQMQSEYMTDEAAYQKYTDRAREHMQDLLDDYLLEGKPAPKLLQPAPEDEEEDGE